jgi:hypothetical protein
VLARTAALNLAVKSKPEAVDRAATLKVLQAIVRYITELGELAVPIVTGVAFVGITVYSFMRKVFKATECFICKLNSEGASPRRHRRPISYRRLHPRRRRL